ncbi:hypothetical protein M3231_21730 [Neobacillus mesonae]|nr:hypothetical protein [Neobacillus mesonae]
MEFLELWKEGTETELAKFKTNIIVNLFTSTIFILIHTSNFRDAFHPTIYNGISEPIDWGTAQFSLLIIITFSFMLLRSVLGFYLLRKLNEKEIANNEINP